MKLRRPSAAACVVAALFVASPAHAIRPFITDDARVVGDKLAQLEMWMLLDRRVLEHNVLVAIGPTDWLELTAGFTHGGVHTGPERGYSITGPILQGKALVLPARDNGWPGLAISIGGLPPLGHGAFTPPGWSGFAYAAVTESLFEEGLLLHANVGISIGDDGASTSSHGVEGADGRLRTLVTAGFGLQARIAFGLHGVAEIYRGDPYDPRTDFPAMQAGFRYIFSDQVQVDGTVGSTLTAVRGAGGHAQSEQWGTIGLRLVTPELW
ncbi:hypothetical protein [Chondromyces crocatus]|uniref:Transporter n=1 Tax=Chondromyces crocatus TaxID=52 RepID=A0A0K1EDN4_CHOCO|nr:hypothetical protein [Chondromyces crocatus]AKT38964.1 uncharacterized protein CMC5_031110 [Chondromyces crocatus]